MQNRDASTPQAHPADSVADNIARLASLFPELLTEGPDGVAVSVDALKVLVGDRTVQAADEKYGLNWHGKRAARQLALMPSACSLQPCPDESVDWDATCNLMIEGDNLDVLKLLQQEYAGRIKLIYIDPPYNTGKGFVYSDNFQGSIRSYLSRTGQGRAPAATHADADADTGRDTETSGRFHTDWLNMIYPRLLLARTLLSPEGLIAVHIDEHEVHALVLLMREIFGEDNELGVAIWDKRNPKGDARGIAYQHESIVLFARDAASLFERSQLLRPKRNAQRMLASARDAIVATKSIEEAGRVYRAWVKAQTTLSGGEAMYERLDATGRVYRLVSMAWPNKKRAPDAYFIPLMHPVTGQPCPVPARGWRNPPETMRRLLEEGLIEFGADERTQPQRVYFLDENMFENVPSILPFGGSDDALLKELGIPFDQPKPVELVASVVGWCTGPDDIVLDVFAGSGSTGHAVALCNAADGGRRRFILAQLPEPLDPRSKTQMAAAAFCASLGKPIHIAELTKERLRRSARKLREDDPASRVDVGFRVFRVAMPGVD